ncbi:hypothetical protein OHA18_01510 [Kribbella sp. NBC_00709]|uniref:hypothetical protein n=1 Tax=Kribbella sp. NBC_00709 TaxID=2975972 RepID=UPI002E297076|nr:hypothetical protein [Kribbella sp. NBC_00709]
MSSFEQLMGEVMATAERFGHREHVRLTWLAPDQTFDELVHRKPGLLNKRLLTHFYESRTLASAEARSGWVEPDVRQFPV